MKESLLCDKHPAVASVGADEGLHSGAALRAAALVGRRFRVAIHPSVDVAALIPDREESAARTQDAGPIALPEGKLGKLVVVGGEPGVLHRE